MILGIDSSAITAGCALYDSGRVIAEQFLNTKHTHSQTLLPMVENMLKSAEVSLSDVETIAVTAGPGSFTGLRIGIASVKGMAMGAGKRCVSISTLEAIAYSIQCRDTKLGPEEITRDIPNVSEEARKNLDENGIITRLCEDRAIKAVDLYEELKKLDGYIILAGDGAEILHKATEENFVLAPLPLRYQRGLGVCLATEGKETIDAAALMPSYLRLPQAERERLEREKNNG